MYDRLLEAVKKLKESQDEIQMDFKQIKKQLDKDNDFYLQKLMRKMEEDLTNYTIQDGYWYYNGVNTNVKAEGIDGEDGEKGDTGETGNGIESIEKTNTEGLVDTYTINFTDGRYYAYNVKNGKDGKDGKKGDPGAKGDPGEKGNPGRDGTDGKDGITPIIKIGNIEVSPEYGGANAKLRKGKDNIFYLDLVLPRGPQGFTGFDGKDGKPGPKGDPGDKGDPGNPGPAGQDGISPSATVTQTSTGATIIITDTNGTTTADISNGEVTQHQLDETNAHIDNVETLSNLFDDKTGTGTDITINGTEDTMLKLGLSGNSYQYSTTGKNLLDLDTFLTSRNVVYTKQNDIYSLTTAGGTYQNPFELNLEEGKTYTLSQIAQTQGSSDVSLDVLKDGSEIGSSYAIGGNTTFTFTADDSTYSIRLDYHDGVWPIIINKPQLEEGSSATDFEPYTNGASPNPDYPQDIEVVTGDNEIKIQSKNLFDLKEYLTERNATYTENTDGSITFNSTDALYSKPMQFSDEDITVSLSGIVTNGTSTVARVGLLNSENQLVASLVEGGSPKQNIMANKIRLDWTSGGTITMKNIQLEKGSITTSYIEHKEQIYPINLGNLELCKIGEYKDSFRQSTGKNLLNIVIPYTLPSSGGNSKYAIKVPELVAGEKYYCKGKCSDGTELNSNNSSMIWFDNNNQQIANLSITSAGFEVTNAMANASSFAIYTNSSLANKTVTELGIYENLTTEYEPYGKGTWYKHTEIGKTVITNENKNIIGAYGTSFNLPRVTITKENLGWKRSWDNGIALFSNYTEAPEASDIADKTFCLKAGANSVEIFDSSFESLEDAQSKLIGTEIYIAQATPTNEPITDTNLISQLNAIKYALAYKDQTNILQTNDEQPFIIDYRTFIKVPTKTSELTNDSGFVTNVDISSKQDIEDNTLQTENKTIPSAINEVNSVAKGANQAVGYLNYQTMITTFNSLDDDVYRVGQNIYIVTLEVPDLWISSVESTSSTYTYTTDADFITALNTNGYVQVGYYKLSMLETQKVDLTNYIKKTDYATSNTPGIVSTASNLGTGMSGTNIFVSRATESDINSKSSAYKPIVPRDLDHAIKVGITTNTNTLTESQKTNACDWLGTGKMVALTQAQYETLKTTGTVTIDSKTYTFDSNTYYFTVEE